MTALPPRFPLRPAYRPLSLSHTPLIVAGSVIRSLSLSPPSVADAYCCFSSVTYCPHHVRTHNALLLYHIVITIHHVCSFTPLPSIAPYSLSRIRGDPLSSFLSDIPSGVRQPPSYSPDALVSGPVTLCTSSLAYSAVLPPQLLLYSILSYNHRSLLSTLFVCIDGSGRSDVKFSVHASSLSSC